MVKKELEHSKYPKVILEFILPENKDELTLATKGPDYFFVLWDIDQWLRGQIKYNSDQYSEEAINALQKARDELHQIMDNHSCSLGDVE